MSEKIDQVFDLLEKVYIELQGAKKEIQGTKEELQGAKNEIQGTKEELQDTKIELQGVKKELQDTKKELKADIHRIEIVIENEIKPDIRTLYELHIQTNKKLEEHDRRFDTLETKVDAISAKTLRHSYDIGALKRREGRSR